jgi:D-tyrosyl-tRNA(Tyr) deacylase
MQRRIRASGFQGFPCFPAHDHPAAMRAVIQRVLEASVRVDGHLVSHIGPGLLLLLGVEDGDELEDARWLAGKVAAMRIFGDDEGKMNLSVTDSGGDVIVVSQFTLHASTKKGNRPSFLRAARPEVSEPLYETFCDLMEKQLGRTVGRGVFGADMKVALVNDGPVTILIDSREKQ